MLKLSCVLGVVLQKTILITKEYSSVVCFGSSNKCTVNLHPVPCKAVKREWISGHFRIEVLYIS